jgi:hypothetical protein
MYLDAFLVYRFTPSKTTNGARAPWWPFLKKKMQKRHLNVSKN